MTRFGQHIRDGDIARVELENECFNFEKERYEKEKEERQRNCWERTEGWEAATKLELEKYKLRKEIFLST